MDGEPEASQLTTQLTVPFALQPSVGQVARVDVSSKVEVVWADNSKTVLLPQVRLLAAPEGASLIFAH